MRAVFGQQDCDNRPKNECGEDFEGVMGELTFLPDAVRPPERSQELDERLCPGWSPMPRFFVRVEEVAAGRAA